MFVQVTRTLLKELWESANIAFVLFPYEWNRVVSLTNVCLICLGMQFDLLCQIVCESLCSLEAASILHNDYHKVFKFDLKKYWLANLHLIKLKPKLFYQEMKVKIPFLLSSFQKSDLCRSFYANYLSLTESFVVYRLFLLLDPIN